MFDDALRRIRSKVGGVKTVLLAGLDGMIVATAGGDDAPPSDLLAASLADLYRKIRSAHQEAGLPPPEELTAGGTDGTVAVRAVTADYLLIALVAPGGSLGRLRFEMRLAASFIEPELV